MELNNIYINPPKTTKRWTKYQTPQEVWRCQGWLITGLPCRRRVSMTRSPSKMACNCLYRPSWITEQQAGTHVVYFTPKVYRYFNPKVYHLKLIYKLVFEYISFSAVPPKKRYTQQVGSLIFVLLSFIVYSSFFLFPLSGTTPLCYGKLLINRVMTSLWLCKDIKSFPWNRRTYKLL